MTHDVLSGAACADFAPTEILFRSEADADSLDDGFAPTQVLAPESALIAWRPATRLAPSCGWPLTAAERPGVVSARPAPRAAWLGRVETALDRVLPGGFGSLLGLFLCVSMSIVLISAMLPLVDRA